MPFKLPLPKLSKMKYNFAPVLHNKYVLYAFLAMTLVRIVFFVNNGDMASVITLGLVGFITSFFSKNMIVILCIALTVSSLLTYGIRTNTHEGLENKDEKAEDKKDENAEDKKDENAEDKKDEKAKDKKDDNNKTGEVNSNETSDKTKDEVKEQYDNLRKEYPEFKEVHAEIMKGIEKMDPLLQKAESFVNKYSKLKQ
jgi:mannitol-specific phosphotransferase system IIBC component